MRAENDFNLEDIDFDLEAPDITLGDFSGLCLDDGLEQPRYIAPPLRAVRQSHVIYENAKKLAANIRFPDHARYDVIVGGNFIFGDFIEAFLVHNRCRCERMVINTLSLNENNIDSLHNLLTHGYINRLDLLTGHYFFCNERHGLVPYIYQQLDIDNRFQYAVCKAHMKHVTMQTLGGKSIVIHGSANLRSSTNLEQFTIEDNPELLQFYNDTSDKIIAQYSTVNKKGLWGKELINLIKQTS